MLHVLWTVTILKCPYVPKVFIYTRAVKMFIINFIVRKSSPPPPPPPPPPPTRPLPPAPKVCLHAQLINKNKNKFTVASQLLHLMRKGNKNKTAKQRKGGRGVALCPCYVHLLQSLQSTCLICTSLHSDVKVCKQPVES